MEIPEQLKSLSPEEHYLLAHSMLDELGISFHEHTATILRQKAAQVPPFQMLFVAHGRRVGYLLDSAKRLNRPEDFQTISSIIRTLFEISIEVLFLSSRARLTDPERSEDEVVSLHELLAHCGRQRTAYRAPNHPDVKALGSVEEWKRISARDDVQVSAQSRKKFGLPLQDATHWHTEQLADRVRTIHSLQREKNINQSHELYYPIASKFVHGGLGRGLYNATCEKLLTDASLLIKWCLEFLPRDILQPLLAAFPSTGSPASVSAAYQQTMDAIELRLNAWLRDRHARIESMEKTEVHTGGAQPATSQP